MMSFLFKMVILQFAKSLSQPVWLEDNTAALPLLICPGDASSSPEKGPTKHPFGASTVMGVPPSSLVYFMENPIQNWMMGG